MDVERAFLTRCPEETAALARELGRRLRSGEVVALAGELGSGKTTFTRGLVEGVGAPPGTRVSSPTYVLEHVYEAPLPVRHLDAYRLAGPEELLALGFEEHLDTDAVLVLEWADRVASCLPGDTLEVRLDPADDGLETRRITLRGDAARWGARLEALRGPDPGTPGAR